MMKMMKSALAFVALLGMVSSDAKIVNSKIQRNVDLQKSVAVHKTKIEFVDNDAAVKEYSLVFPEEQASHLSVLKIKDSGAEVAQKPLLKGGFAYYQVKFSSPVAKGKSGTLNVVAKFTHSITPYPEEIAQEEEQLMLYKDTQFVASPYVTKSEETIVKVPAGGIESYSELSPVSKKSSSVTYGPYKDTPALSKGEELKVHFKHTGLFLTATRVVKEIEVSMWGRVSFEEVYEMKNSGAALKGPFSRIDYMSNRKGNSFRQLTANLPKQAMNPYYRDIIGNVTTSNFLSKKKRDSVLQIETRFPVFGGWKTEWYQGYSVPTNTIMTGDAKTGSFALSPLFSTGYKDAVVDDLTVKVILPEGAKNVQCRVPGVEIESEDSARRFTYLDSTIGRPVIILRKTNVLTDHNVPMEITFDYDETMMYHEPALLVGFYFTMFFLYMFFSRLNLNISKAPKKKTA